MSECTKVKFASEKLALEHIERIRKKQGDRAFIPQYTYLCEICATWHLTKLTQETEHKVTELHKKLSELRAHFTEMREKSERRIFFLRQEIKKLREENEQLRRETSVNTETK